ncbi:zinc-ribbon domain-containing protein [Actinokineospora iranica]|uniref:Zinc-ribbon domain-containing protein n=1 Tax=Actinokineospora iranica TaxID=1271860 RepID=A0A1G6TY21_9PSEU|nr:zinc-ribbon domain-containing protein [Actinokineospora iranica]SDD34062.1 zinc-ribbon domain-containing protein [Actinokineospora iranica]
MSLSCPQCGAPVQATDDFCGNCGTYLGWLKDAPPAPGTREAADAAGTRPAAHAQENSGHEETGDRDGPDPGDDRASGQGDARAVGQRDGDAGPKSPVSDAVAGSAERGSGTADERPRRDLAAAGDTQFGPVQPGLPVARRPLPSSSAEAVVEGPPCPVCGTANPPGRRFCRRCAAPLGSDGGAEDGPSRRRWRWRGDGSRWLRRLVALIVVAVLVVAGFLLFPHVKGLVEDLRDRTATPAPIGPTGTTATAEVPGHPAAAAADGLSNRYWGAPAVGDAVEFGFAGPFRLLTVVVHAGASTKEEDFFAQARPAALDLVLTSADGATRTVPVPLADQPGPQRTDLGVSDVVRVRVVVRAAVGLGAGRHVALGEVEFFMRP